MPIISNFPSAGDATGTGLPLAAVTNVQTLVASGKVYVKWTDPDDIVQDDGANADWVGTLLVRKAGSVPTSRRDGTIVLDSTIRNQYADTYFCDSGLTDGVTYYYKFFSYTTDVIYNDIEENEFVAIPTAQVEGIDSWLVTSMSASEEAGDGKIAVTWTDPAAIIVSDGVTLASWGSTTIVVKAGEYASDRDDDAVAYRNKVTTRNMYSNSALTISGLENGVTYYISFFPETTDGGINDDESQRTTGVANRIALETVPSQSGSLVYTGNILSPAWDNYNTATMTLGGVTSATNAGEYIATFTPAQDYRWSDGSYDALSVVWSIAKASGSFSLSESSVELSDNNTSAVVTVNRLGDGVVSAVSNNTDIVTVSVSETAITITAVDQTVGNTATVTVSVAAGTNHEAAAEQTIIVEYVEASSVSAVLNDNTWEQISQVSAAGQGANYWAVGDCKSVDVSGTIGTLAVSGTYYVYILGFAHNGATNTIDFGTFKTAATGGVDVCLIDSKYSSTNYDGTKYFNINHWGTSSTPHNTNYGGWKGCDARYDILGSTDTAPSGYGSTATTSRTGYDASATCATNPVANTLMAALPSDLRAVMKPMTIYTNNVGNSNNTAAGVSASIDYLPLLAEFEIFGTRTYANDYEQNYQAQYDYFKAGNSKVKYRHSATGSTANWWERSPNYNSAYNFCLVNANGGALYFASRYSRGLAPAFRV